MNVVRVCLFLICMITLSGAAWDTASQKVREGNRLFREEKYTEALNRYHEAQVVRPDAPEIPFNMGNSFYRQEKYEESQEAHTQSLKRKTGPLAAKAHYNIGSALYRGGDLQGALKAYKQAIDLDSSDFDTKYNIEFLQKKMEPSQQKQKTSSQQEREEEKEQKEQEEKEENTPAEGDQGGEDEEDQETDPEGGAQDEMNISEEDTERLLNALQGEERPLPTGPKKMGNRMKEPPVDKDW